MRWRRSSLVLFLALLWLPAAAATARDATVCAEAATEAARASGVPEGWLQAIALVESGPLDGPGRTAWPWAVNDHGEGFWFAGKREAMRHVERRLAAGKTSVDVGCFQINWALARPSLRQPGPGLRAMGQCPLRRPFPQPVV